KICSEQRYLPAITGVNSDRQHGSEANNVIAPEHSLDLRQVRLVEVSPVTGWLEIHASNFHVQRIFLWSHYEVRAIAAEFATDLVADIGGHADHGCGYTYAKRDGGAG